MTTAKRLLTIETMLKTLVAFQKEILSLHEAALYTGLSVNTLYNMNKNNVIPFSKPGGKVVYYMRNDLNAWMQKNRVRSQEETEMIAASFNGKNRTRKINGKHI